jgi:molybdopterin converting factor small subunit
MTIRVEFFGIPRARANVPGLEVEAATLGEALEQVVQRIPQLAECCICENRLRGGYLANINTQTFTSEPTTPLGSGDTVLILSADVGG